MDAKQKAAQAIRKQKQSLAEIIVEQIYRQRPERWEQLGEEGRQKSIRDVRYHLSYLSESLAASDPRLFVHYITWVKGVFEKLGFSEDVLHSTLKRTQDILEQQLPHELALEANAYVDIGLARLGEAVSSVEPFIREGAPLVGLANDYLSLMLEGQRNRASQRILDAVESGTPVRSIYLHVFQPVQREVGRLWEMNQVSVAEEHYCTAATQLIMSQLYPRIFTTKRTGHRLVATCVGGELHEIGVRMVADFFEMDGWDTYYLGANTPKEDVIKAVEQRGADLLAISATLPTHVSEVVALIKDARSSRNGPSVKILVGGYPFNTIPNLWEEVRADGYAKDAQEAVTIGRRLIAENER